MTFTRALSTNNYGPAKFIVSASSANGTHTTIASAITAASSGDTIFIRTGTYTENITLKAGVNLAAFGSDGLTTTLATGTGDANVIILGSVTASFTGSVCLSGIQLKTNGAAALITSGSNTGELFLSNCSIFANNATGMTFNNANLFCTFFTCYFINSSTNLMFTNTVGAIDFEWCIFSLSGLAGASTTATSNVYFNACDMSGLSMSTSSTGTVTAVSCQWQYGATTLLTTAGTGTSRIIGCYLNSTSASTIDVGSGTVVVVDHTTVVSSNTNAITGAGTLQSGIISFGSTSSTVNTTTQIGYPTKIGVEGTFTPTLIGGTVPGTTTYTAQHGYYTRIGNLVTVNAYIAISAATGTGNITLGNLPFTIRNQTFGYVNGAIFWQGSAGWVWPAGATSISCLGNFNTTTALVWASGTAIGGGFVQMANAGLAVTYSLTYQV